MVLRVPFIPYPFTVYMCVCVYKCILCVYVLCKICLIDPNKDDNNNSLAEI